MAREKQVIKTLRLVIPSKDRGLRALLREYDAYKKQLLPRVQAAVRQVIKDPSINVYAQQKWMVDKKISEYIKRLPFHPMPFHRQSVWLEKHGEDFYLHFKTRQKEGEVRCLVVAPPEWRDLLEKACGENNEMLGQVELVEDRRGAEKGKHGRIVCHVALRLPKPQPYEPKGWLGVDTGWNKLAVSVFASTKKGEPEFHNVDFHGKKFRPSIVRLKALLKDYQRRGKAAKKWNNRLQNTIKYAVGATAKEIVLKAKNLEAGVAMEDLTFQSVTKRYLIPRHKLQVAVRTLCERLGVPFTLVPPHNTSITCPRCDFRHEKNREGERFLCLHCGYEADADIVGAMNIARKALGVFESWANEEEKRGKKKQGRAAPATATKEAAQHATENTCRGVYTSNHSP